MYRKLLLSLFLLGGLSAFSQPYVNSINSSGLPSNGGQILDVVDYNNDGYDDVIYQNTVNGQLKIYRNLKGVFSDVTTFTGFPYLIGNSSTTVVSYDYNGDGFQDIFVYIGGATRSWTMIKNNCGSNFTDVSAAIPLPSAPDIVESYGSQDPRILVSDYDKDKDNDLLFVSKLTSGAYTLCVLKNNLSTFSLDTGLIVGFGSSTTPFISLLDFDNDMDEDLIIIRQTSVNLVGQIDLYENPGNGNYSVVSSTGLTSNSTIGFATIWDYNNDGYSDILLGTKEVVLPGSGNSGNRVFRNNSGTGNFTDVTASVITYQTINVGDNITSHVFDADNDGDWDVLWEVDRTSIGTSAPALMINNGSNIFTNRAGAFLSGITSTARGNNHYTVFDYDNDGVMDIFQPGVTGSVPNASLNKGATSTNNFLTIRLLSCNGQTDPRGAKVLVVAGSVREFRTYNSQGSSTAGINGSERLQFGLGSNGTVDSLVIIWPDLTVTIETGLTANQHLTRKDGSCTLGTPLTFDIGTDTSSTCNFDTATIIAPSGYVTYQWNNGDITPDTRITSIGWYYCTVTNLDGCSAMDSIYVTFGKSKIKQTDTSICSGSTLVLDATPRFDCSPYGAPAHMPVNSDNQPLPGYEYIGKINGHWYYRALVKSTWTKAAQDALAAGGYLVVINNLDEQQQLQTNTKLIGKNHWLGMYRTNVTSPFVWMNCDDVNYTNWSSTTGSPTGGPQESFVYMRSDACSDAWQWKNTDETTTLPDPCESNFYGLVEFDPSTNVSYKWSTGASSATISVNPTISGPISVTVSQNNATCLAAINVNVIDVNNLIPVDSLLECKSSFTYLSATPGLLTYLWSNGRTTDIITVNKDGWYKVTATSVEGCKGTDSVYVTIKNSSIITPDTSVCSGTLVFVRGPVPPYSYVDFASETFQILPFIGWNSLVNQTFNGTKVFGAFRNDSIYYSWPVSYTHDSVELSFDLYIHDTWEGDCSLVGPDLFKVRSYNLFGSTTVMSNTFSNNPGCTQSYPVAGSPSTTGATTVGLPRRCFNGATSTTLYHITKKFRHNGPILDLSFIGDLVDTESVICNESWSLDNVSIKVRTPGAILWSTGDTTQNIYITATLPNQDIWVRVPVGNTFCYDTVNISTFTGQIPTPLFTQDTLITCFSSQQNLSLPNNYDFYAWSTGDLSQKTIAYNTGWYAGAVATLTGCYGVDSVFYIEGNYSLNPINDTFVCAGSSMKLTVNLNNDCSPFGAPVNTGYQAAQPIAGYTYKGEYRGHHYYLADTRSSWNTAAQNAINNGGHLACINDTFEQDFIADVVDSNAWLGLYRGANGYHIWMNCDTLTYTNWAGAEPSPSLEDYVFMYSKNCAEPKKWNSYLNSDSASTDPCLSGIYGLLEIEVYDYHFNWIGSADTTQSIFVSPTSKTTYYALAARYQTIGFCGAGNISVDVNTENFKILIDSVSKVSCSGDTAMIEAAPGYSNYTWNNGELTQVATYKNYVGWAYCTYKGAICTFTDSVYVNVPGAFSVKGSITDVTCYGANDGIGTVTISGGSSPFQITWAHNGSTAVTQTSLSPGVYNVTVIDTNGCTSSDQITITDPIKPLTLNLAILKGISCSGDSNGVLIPTIDGGEPNYSGTWVGSGAPDTLWNAFAGTFTYTVTDNRGCTIVKDIVVTDPPALRINTTTIYSLICTADSNGVVFISASGGTSPYSYLWNGIPQPMDTIKMVTEGSHTAIVIDNNNCKDTAYVTMIAANPETCGLVVSQGFTPNGDGRNDYFYIKGIEGYSDNTLTVFNRWGETVYTKVNYRNEWDGKPSRNTILTSGDGVVPNDTYYYVLVTHSNNKTYTGYVYVTK